MTQAMHAIQDGYNYQARVFWQYVAKMLTLNSNIAKVGFEDTEIKSFDDIVVEYNQPQPDGRGGFYEKDYIQIKFHRNQTGGLTWESLMDPKFVGATTYSFLQKLQQAIAQRGENPKCRVILRQHWTVKHDDPLAIIYDNSTGALNLEKLFSEGPRSKMGKIRNAWKEHLGIDDEELRFILQFVRFTQEKSTLKDLHHDLNTSFSLVGIHPVPHESLTFDYDDLIWTMHQEAKTGLLFDRAGIIAKLSSHNRFTPLPTPSRSKRLGIRSFLPMAVNLQDQVEAMIALEHHFDDRTIRDPQLWNTHILLELQAFFEEHISDGSDCDLALETHTTTAFTAGYSSARARGQINCLVGKKIMARQNLPYNLPLWTTEVQSLSPAKDIAVAVSVTHDITADVQCYINKNPDQFGQLLSYIIAPQPGQRSVEHADHTFALAQDLVAQLRTARSHFQAGSRLHLFMAIPNFLAFELGRMALTLGPIQLYEYDRNSGQLGAYQPSLVLPH